MGGGVGGQVVCVLAFYSVDLSSSPTNMYNFHSVKCLKRTKINKESGLAHILKKETIILSLPASTGRDTTYFCF